MRIRIATAALLAVFIFPAGADDKADYNRRAAEADQAAFRQLDLDQDRRLTLEEVRSDLNFGPRFNDADLNRDGVVTSDEMQRYLERSYGTPMDKRTF